MMHGRSFTIHQDHAVLDNNSDSMPWAAACWSPHVMEEGPMLVKATTTYAALIETRFVFYIPNKPSPIAVFTWWGTSTLHYEITKSYHLLRFDHERGGAQTLLLSGGEVGFVMRLQGQYGIISDDYSWLCMTTLLDKSPRSPRFLFRSLAILLNSKLLLLF